MNLNTLKAISPLDGRYAGQLDFLREECSEFGLIKYRVQVEIDWLKCLCEPSSGLGLPPLTAESQTFLQTLKERFHLDDAETIKTIEKETNHDVKAVEYFLKKAICEQTELKAISEFIHFACTSEDINNLAYALMLKKVRDHFLLPTLEKYVGQLEALSHSTTPFPMLSRTHGQPASPTTMGKEIANVVHRLKRQIYQIAQVPIMGKLNGAVGNFNAHYAAYPEANWERISQTFVTSLGLVWQSHTTQIEPHDYIAELLDAIARLNTILIDFARDIWGYISVGYFKQKAVESEVGSSTMPHKINPIDFENAEGNLAMANAVMDFLSRRLPISRWQRDLVDSTLLRNLGVGLGHSFLAYRALEKGLSKLALNPDKMAEDLNDNWEVLGEAIQTVMRRYGLPSPYEQLKALSRGKKLSPERLREFIAELALPEEAKNSLLALTPATYLGSALCQNQKL